jgi:hypothetical protein
MPWGTEVETINVVIDGREYPVNATDNFAATVNRLAAERGWGSFRVYIGNPIDGREIVNAAGAPATFAGLTLVTITRDDKAG